ncbi:MAG: leucine--tRNA ligase [Candidatus Woykebacteria bacterium RBG_13_40_15]|uniref:Leucine--tRNA ligase n=1 Tax=Candidatus Woykebacteria bacterium RBG_13_40_15 TaxID=1802593 RepID=A0A1G1W6N9_9BACT|nr:MAG: leucine--tRNA ligase [Candidatus Woykebacteria bacterium RBG_13_40_15]
MDIPRYDPKEIEKKYREKWSKDKLFNVDVQKAKKPFFNLMMFPYPSGEGLHVGHVYAFSGSDTFGRFKRMSGFDVFEPMGFDSFGIHSENYAIKKNIHPKELIEETTTFFREKQLKRLGALFDWDHQAITSDPDYYKWTQWIFTQLFKAGLAMRKKAPVDWCPSCKTVLADEQVIAGKCERCGTSVVQKELEQWFLKITDYAEKLLANLDHIDWSESTKQMQRNWIGKSEGVNIHSKIKDLKIEFEAFDSVPQTFRAQTFTIIAPEHPLVPELVKGTAFEKPVLEFVEKIKKERTVKGYDPNIETEGIFTGRYVDNPFGTGDLPIWISSFVVMGYGSGIVHCSAHDERDFAFAKKYGIPLRPVMFPEDRKLAEKVRNLEVAYCRDLQGVLEQPKEFTGRRWGEVREEAIKYLEKKGIASRAINYHLRDWLISRQRYWGPPIPMIYCEKCGKEGKGEEVKGKVLLPGWYTVPSSDLPVLLPDIKDYRPKGAGVSPLAAVSDFVNVKCPLCGSQARRETDVSDTFLDSSWYFLRYPTVNEPNSKEVAFDKGVTKKWLPVDMYIGGNEHAVLHLLYTRFVTMALNDIGLIDFEEPFKKFRSHGLIIHGGAKMSKSRGNVVNPNEYMDTYGTDTLRMYLLFIGPYELGGDFADVAISGVYRFLNRVWKITHEISDQAAPSANSLVAREINKLVKKITEDIEFLRFNTAIAALMEFLNFAYNHKGEIDRKTLKKFLILLSVFAPFISEELWNKIGEKYSIHNQSWPTFDEESLKEEKLTIAVQVNGKLRGTIEIQNSELSLLATRLSSPKSGEAGVQNEVDKRTREEPRIKVYIEGKKLKNVIYVPGKIINYVLDKID